MTARLSAKSQTVIPKSVRDKLGVGPGDLLLFEERGGQIVVRAFRPASADDPFALFTEWAGEEDEEAYADL